MNKKEEIIKFLSNTKVYVNGKSEEIQKKLFSLGFITKENKNTVLMNKHMPFIIINADKTFSYCNNMNTFTLVANREVSAETILNIKVEKEYNFKPFDKVLARSKVEEVWQIEFFERVDEDYYICLRNSYKECIPYNKKTAHLLGTNKDYIK